MEINNVWNHQSQITLESCPSCDCNTRQDLGMYHWRWSIQHTVTVWELHLLFNNLKSQVMGMLLKVSPVLAAPLVVESATTQRVEQCTQWEPGLQHNVGKTIMNHPFGNGFIEPIYGDLVDDLLLFYPPYTLLIYWSLFCNAGFPFRGSRIKTYCNDWQCHNYVGCSLTRKLWKTSVCVKTWVPHNSLQSDGTLTPQTHKGLPNLLQICRKVMW